MAPKKVAAAPAEEKVSAEEKVADAPAAVKTKVKPKVTKLTTTGNPSTLSMVVEVLKKNSERKGTSVQAIRSRILATHPTVDPVRLKSLLRSALNKGIEKGILIRPLNSIATGATGRFKLAKPGPKSKAGEGDKMSENVDPNEQPKEKTKEKAKKVVKKVPKKLKVEKEETKGGNVVVGFHRSWGIDLDIKATISLTTNLTFFQGDEVKATKKEKMPEAKAKAAASKPKKDAAEKTDKAPAPPKKPKSKTPAAEEGTKPKKEPAKKKAEPSKAKDSEEKPAAKDGKKGKK
ncbi:protein B4 [Bufo gargarizans]|uniref:protein B4 n=1 Tax=Bufo gargarizans TaxID=30331 RepID=UPI001CF221F4|nr:protein B4 [Bufo gargarizans]